METIDREYSLILKKLFCLLVVVVGETTPWGSHGHLKGHHPLPVGKVETCPMKASAMGHCSLSSVFLLVYSVFVDGP